MKKIKLLLLFAIPIGIFAQEKTAIDYNNEGNEFVRNKDYKSAYKSYIKAIELFEADGKVDINLIYNTGYCAYKAKKYDEALPHLEKSIELGYKKAKPYIYVAQVKYKKKDLIGMRTTLFAGLKKYPNNEHLNLLMSSYYLKQGLFFYNEGNKIKKAANESGLNQTDPETFLAEYAKADMKFQEALPYFKKSYQYNNNNKSTLKALKSVYHSLDLEFKPTVINNEIITLTNITDQSNQNNTKANYQNSQNNNNLIVQNNSTTNYKEDINKTNDIAIQIADIKKPIIKIIEPKLERGFKSKTQTHKITIKVEVKDESGVLQVLINNIKANFIGNNIFIVTLNLGYGDNKIEILATDTQNNIAKESFLISRIDKIEPANTIVDNSIIDNIGIYYALIIGNNNYYDPAISSLDKPISDATNLYNVLTSKYTFEPKNVIFLKNATFVQTIEAFDELSNKVRPIDNIIVFYAGHGWWDEDKNLGYWLPTDAKKKSTAFWLANSRISDYMSSINSKHTLLIADACFSGSIFKTRNAFNDAQPAINKLYELPSKKAMTSGNLKEVPDESAFLHYLVKRLKENNEKYISADVLFSSFRQAVLNNSPTEPQYGTIQNAGDEGGEFIFILK